VKRSDEAIHQSLAAAAWTPPGTVTALRVLRADIWEAAALVLQELEERGKSLEWLVEIHTTPPPPDDQEEAS
jgi:hypothetical protein